MLLNFLPFFAVLYRNACCCKRLIFNALGGVFQFFTCFFHLFFWSKPSEPRRKQVFRERLAWIRLVSTCSSSIHFNTVPKFGTHKVTHRFPLFEFLRFPNMLLYCASAEKQHIPAEHLGLPVNKLDFCLPDVNAGQAAFSTKCSVPTVGFVAVWRQVSPFKNLLSPAGEDTERPNGFGRADFWENHKSVVQAVAVR